MPIGIGASLRRAKRFNRSPGRKKYILSLVLFGANISALVIGGVVGVMDEATARDNYRGGYNSSYNSSNDRRSGNQRQQQPNTRQTNQQQSNVNRNQTNTYNQPSNQPPQEVTNEQAPATTANVAPPVEAQPVQQEQQMVTPQIAQPVIAADPAPIPDTSEEVALVASSQAEVTAAPVTYTTQQISIETRNRLIAIAVSALTSGLLIYIMSFSNIGGTPMRRTIPVRYFPSSSGAALS